MSEVSGSPRSTKLDSWFSASWMIFSGGMISGATVSMTLIVWKYSEIFPEVSIAVQVTIVSPSWNNTGASLEILGLLSTWSRADALPISTYIPETSVISSIIFSGPVITGWIVSSMIICCVSDAVLPEVSVAVQVTTVSPRGNDSGASFSTDLIPTVSKVLGADNSI